MELRDFLVFLSTAGSALAAWWLMDNVLLLSRLEGANKRYAAFALTAGLAVLGYLGQVGMLYAPAPANWRGWVESLFAVAGAAVGLNQIIHAQIKSSQVHRGAA